MSGVDNQPRQVSVVIPAHNEATVIGPCLRALLDEPAVAAGTLRLDAVVVANGCDDDTAEVARRHGVRVVELAEGSKTAALNTGDDATPVLPRVYLDADIVLSVGTLTALASALSVDAPRIAAPAPVFDAHGASWPSRAFHRVFSELPYAAEELGGVGVYGVSAPGRARWAEFPAVAGDDLFVQRQFEASERIRVAGQAVVRVPRTTSSLLAVRTRVAAGNAALSNGAAGPRGPDLSTSANGTARALGGLLARRPWLAPDVLVYVTVVLAARRLGRRAAPGGWQRDASTR